MKLLSTITANIFSNIEPPIIFLIVAIVLNIVNIILGSIDAMFNKEFDWGKFFSGIEKMIIVALTIMLTIITLNLFAYGLTEVKIVIPADYVSVGEVVIIVVTWCVDLAKEVTEKIKSLRDLKYVKYEDIKYQQNTTNVQEMG